MLDFINSIDTREQKINMQAPLVALVRKNIITIQDFTKEKEEILRANGVTVEGVE